MYKHKIISFHYFSSETIKGPLHRKSGTTSELQKTEKHGRREDGVDAYLFLSHRSQSSLHTPCPQGTHPSGVSVQLPSWLRSSCQCTLLSHQLSVTFHSNWKFYSEQMVQYVQHVYALETPPMMILSIYVVLIVYTSLLPCHTGQILTRNLTHLLFCISSQD